MQIQGIYASPPKVQKDCISPYHGEYMGGDNANGVVGKQREALVDGLSIGVGESFRVLTGRVLVFL